uniref:Uncharacterized protein n=1 Tax=Thermocrinis ruber TaxID=75906 RepID=A0A7C5X1R8_9AQUI
MGFMDKLRRKREQEQEYEDVPIEEEGVIEEKRKGFLDGGAVKWGGIFVGSALALFLASRLFSSGEGVVIKSDPELQKKLLEETLKSQSQMNQQILDQLKEVSEQLKRLKESKETKTEEKEKGNVEKEKRVDSGSTFKIEESGSSSPPPPPPPPPSSTPLYTEPVKPPEEYKPKINRVERKDEQSKADGNLLAQSGMSDVPPAAKPEKEKPTEGKRTVYLPAGTTLKGRIINAFPAPVGGEKFPAVLIELDGHARLPNNYRLDLSRCLVIAKAEGSYVLERAKLETYKLSCILKNGKVIEVSPKGMVISGEDGLEGVKGKFLNVNREQLLTYLGGTTVSGFFSALQQGQITKYSTAFGITTDIKNEFLYALYGSLAQTWNEFAKFYLEEAKKIVPVVVVEAGMPVYIVLVDGVSLEVSVDEIRKGL